jgi:hypothetical protein
MGTAQNLGRLVLLLAFASLRLFGQLFQFGLVFIGQGAGDRARGRKNAFNQA